MAKARKSRSDGSKQRTKVQATNSEPSGTATTPKDGAAEGTNAPGMMSKGGPIADVGHSDPNKPGFLPIVLDKTVITAPLFAKFEEKLPVYSVIIDINLLYKAGREEAKSRVQELIIKILEGRQDPRGVAQGFNVVKTRFSQQYVFAVLSEDVIKQLVRDDGTADVPGEKQTSSSKAIYHIWPDFPINKLTTKSVSTVKADAARNAFSAFGDFQQIFRVNEPE
jgi:hypothetical protein